MNCKWCAYAHHLEQRTRTIIQGARSVRSGWTETNGSASGVFGRSLEKVRAGWYSVTVLIGD